MVIVSLAAIFLALFLGFRKKLNVGLIGTVFALIIGCFFMKMSPNAVFSALPYKIIFKIVPITMFYGFALENGTLHLLIDKFLYRCARWIQYLPWGVYVLCILLGISGIGAGAMASIMAPLVLSIGVAAKLDLLVCSAALALGAAVGSSFVTSEGGTTSLSIIEQTSFGSDALSIGMYGWCWMLVIFTASMLVIFLLRKGYRRPASDYSMEKPAAFTALQKKNLVLIALITTLVIAPLFIRSIFPSDFTKFLHKQMDIGFVMLLGAFLAALLGLGDLDTVIKKRIPWSGIVVISGMTLLISVAVEAGLSEAITNLMVNNVPLWLVPTLIAMCAGFLSCFCSVVSVVLPTMYPLAAEIAVATGLSAPLLFCAVFVGASATGVSPFSTGGSIMASCCPDDEQRDKLIRQLVITAIANITITALAFLVL